MTSMKKLKKLNLFENPLKEIDSNGFKSLENLEELNLYLCAHIFDSIMIVDNLWMKILEDNCLIPFLHEIDENKFYRRQLLPPVYRLNGAVDVSWCKNVIEKKQLYVGKMAGYIMPPERSVDLDSELDFALAEVLLNRRNNESNN